MNSRQQMQIIDRISKTSSRNDKEEMVKRLDTKILTYTYDPFKKYYLKPPTVHTENGGLITDMGFRVLDILASSKYRGNKAALLVREYMRTLDPLSAELYRRILLKDLRCGISSKTINKVYPNLIPDEFCPLCEEYDESKIVYPCYVSPKIDGDRGINVDQEFRSRNWKKIDGLDYILKELDTIPFDLDGELKHIGRSFSVGSGGLRSKGPKPGYAFYVITIRDFDLPFATVVDIMRGFPKMNHVVVLPNLLCHNKEQVDRVYMSALATGREGIVIKSPYHLYECRRTFNWMRKVPEIHVDVLCVGTYRGEAGKKYENTLGGIEVMYKGKRNRVGTGFDDSQRDFYHKYPDNIIGKYVEVWFKEETDYGHMRQPRFKRVRHDK